MNLKLRTSPDTPIRTHLKIVVRGNGEAWSVRCHHQGVRSFADEKEALRAAIDMAQTNGKNGHPSMVVSCSPAGEKTMWTYGKDPYPA
jgi:hypothetical protein